MTRADGFFALVLGSPIVLVAVLSVAVPESWSLTTIALALLAFVYGLRLMVGGIRAFRRPPGPSASSSRLFVLRWTARTHFLVLASSVASIALARYDPRFLDTAWFLAAPLNMAFLLAAVVVGMLWLATPRTRAAEQRVKSGAEAAT